jgi:hypothetical protein
MITFMSPECLSKLSPADPSHSIIKELIDRSVQESKLSKHHWIPERDGFFILVQPEDLEITLDELHPGETLRTIPYEGVHYKDGHYIAVTLLNNQASLVWVINSVGLPDDFRKILEDNMVPSVD